MAYEFGVMPWHVDPHPPELTESEIREFMDWLNRRDDEVRRRANTRRR